MSRKTQSMKFAVALGISRGRRISNILDVLISYVNNFTKHFCKTVWNCSVCLRHDDDNYQMRAGGESPLRFNIIRAAESAFQVQLKVLWNSVELLSFSESQRARYSVSGDGQAKLYAAQRGPSTLFQDLKKFNRRLDTGHFHGKTQYA